ncbi:OmpA family protein [Vibrio hepatarius]|uniref:OmpA family protein n=1 Tax=Vibrio hepatarius TaxID=171383 RepID=UPI001C0855EA|nr:OmpA family protein [Vibrio hepatarius]MBU2899098.1 OmpA family protein [Vibrio hepatarius]
MKNINIYILTTISIALSNTSLADEYDYISTPNAIQVADLLDDDRDGVINARDLCPDTLEGAEINNDGCAKFLKEEEELALRVLFAHDSYDINSAFEDQIQTMADFLEKYKSASIEVQGHTSKIGPEAYNYTLSEQRANAVQDELLYYGIDPERVTIVGFGESLLENEGDDEVAHATNRRVTATVVGLSEKVVEEWNIFSIIEK